jgi:N-acetylglutamate synthase-like GNAT family acetyltransferase
MIKSIPCLFNIPCDYDILPVLRARKQMKTVIRPATEKDQTQIEVMLRNWTLKNRTITNAPASGSSHLSVLETQGALEGVSFWEITSPDEIELLGFALSENATQCGFGAELLKREIMAWAKLKVSRISLIVPESESRTLTALFRACGFISDGACWPGNRNDEIGLRFYKKLVYETINYEDSIDFLGNLFMSWGYDIREEQDGLTYRMKPESMSPFFSSVWHRINMLGGQIIISPPARPLEAHELETLFFPLIVKYRDETPLLITIDRKRASSMIELPQTETNYYDLFNRENPGSTWLGRDLVYSFPTGFQKIRRGLPILFYVNRLGAVGEARTKSWSFEDPTYLCKTLYNGEKGDLEHLREHAVTEGSKVGKALVLRYEFYRVFKNPVSLEKMKLIDTDFNPQRQRSISYDFFREVAEIGTW